MLHPFLLVPSLLNTAHRMAPGIQFSCCGCSLCTPVKIALSNFPSLFSSSFFLPFSFPHFPPLFRPTLQNRISFLVTLAAPSLHPSSSVPRPSRLLSSFLPLTLPPLHFFFLLLFGTAQERSGFGQKSITWWGSFALNLNNCMGPVSKSTKK